MNERIRELETQCKVFVTDGASRICVVDTEKFAELIVRECADICTARKLTPAAFVASELREYFGVCSD